MKLTALLIPAALAVSPLLGADSGPKAEVAAAAKKLSEAPNYSWTSTTESPPRDGNQDGNRRGGRPGPTNGKSEKDGLVWISMSRGDNTTEAVKKGSKAVVKTDDGWKTPEEIRAAAESEGDDGQRRGRGRGFIGRMLENYKTPDVQVAELTGKVKEITKTDDAYTGELTEEAVKELLTFGGRRRDGSEPPAPTNSKGSVKFWLKDGAISKYQVHVQGTVRFNENEINMDRTTTVEIKDVGSTKIDVADEAKAKLTS